MIEFLRRVDGHAVEVDHHLAVAVGGVEPLEAISARAKAG